MHGPDPPQVHSHVLALPRTKEHADISFRKDHLLCHPTDKHPNASQVLDFSMVFNCHGPFGALVIMS